MKTKTRLHCVGFFHRRQSFGGIAVINGGWVYSCISAAGRALTGNTCGA